MSIAAAVPTSDVASVTRAFFDQLCAVTASDSGESSRAASRQLAASFHPEVRAAYRSMIAAVLEASTAPLDIGDHWKQWRDMPGLSYYEQVMTSYISVLLFRGWSSAVPLTLAESSALAEAMVVGIVGYRLIDVHVDDQQLGAEAAVLGSHLVRIHERCLAALFGYERAHPVLDRYTAMYTSVEYTEKAARWKQCPFTWDRVDRLGWKGAPIFAIVHLLLQREGKPDSFIQEVVDALCGLVAVMQLEDDVHDAPADLASGIETLPAAGFYQWNEGHPIDSGRVREFFQPERISACFTAMLELVKRSSSRFDALDEPLFALFAEQTRNGVLQRIPTSSGETA